MASINGFSLMKEGELQERGYLYYTNYGIYYNGDRVGKYDQMDNIHKSIIEIDDEEIRKELTNTSNKWYEKHPIIRQDRHIELKGLDKDEGLLLNILELEAIQSRARARLNQNKGSYYILFWENEEKYDICLYDEIEIQMFISNNRVIFVARSEDDFNIVV